MEPIGRSTEDKNSDYLPNTILSSWFRGVKSIRRKSLKEKLTAKILDTENFQIVAVI
jgi:hypothetical protein